MDTYQKIQNIHIFKMHDPYLHNIFQELLTLPEHMSSPPFFSGVCVIRSLVLCVCFVYRCLFFFLWPLCYLFFIDIRILITPLVSSNSSYHHENNMYNVWYHHDYKMYQVWGCIATRYIMSLHVTPFVVSVVFICKLCSIVIHQL